MATACAILNKNGAAAVRPNAARQKSPIDALTEDGWSQIEATLEVDLSVLRSLRRKLNQNHVLVERGTALMRDTIRATESDVIQVQPKNPMLLSEQFKSQQLKYFKDKAEDVDAMRKAAGDERAPLRPSLISLIPVIDPVTGRNKNMSSLLTRHWRF